MREGQEVQEKEVWEDQAQEAQKNQEVQEDQKAGHSWYDDSLLSESLKHEESVATHYLVSSKNMRIWSDDRVLEKLEYSPLM